MVDKRSVRMIDRFEIVRNEQKQEQEQFQADVACQN